MEDPSFERLASRRLVIRRFASGDAQALASYRSDAEVARYQDWECPFPVSEAMKFIASLHERAPGTPGTWFQFAVGLAPSGTLIGDVGLRTSRSDSRQAELGFTLAAAHQGHGYATEAVRSVVQYAFLQLGMHRVMSRTDARNLPAQRLLERLRFRREGEFRECTWFKGVWATDLLYAQLESEWRVEHAGQQAPVAESRSVQRRS
jgi:aminoglycoside 6'-N-acetyltransferase